MINPYLAYAISFCLALMAYALGWSALYPPLSYALLFFVIGTILLHIVFGIFWSKRIRIPRSPTSSYFRPLSITIFVYVLWIAEFVQEGGIPLIKILLNQPYNYRLFGIPSLHVFIVTFGSFFTLFLFSLFITSGKRHYLYLYLLNLLPALLIYNRGMLLFNIMASAIALFLLSPAITWGRVTSLFAGFIILMYAFGALGTMRVSFEAKTPYDSDIFLDIGDATAAFRESGVPREFFWGYIYLSSPIANLQYNINTFHVPAFSLRRLGQHINNEILFDFISKRINRLLLTDREGEHTIPEKPFNVSTAYSHSFSYQGWTGMWLMAAFLLAFPLVYMKVLPSNAYSISGVAILCTLYLFLCFDNSIRFTGFGFQLVYPFLLPRAENFAAWLQLKTGL